MYKTFTVSCRIQPDSQPPRTDGCMYSCKDDCWRVIIDNVTSHDDNSDYNDDDNDDAHDDDHNHDDHANHDYHDDDDDGENDKNNDNNDNDNHHSIIYAM